LTSIGNSTYSVHILLGDDVARLPDELAIHYENSDDLKRFTHNIYGSVSNASDKAEYLAESAILVLRNDIANEINDAVSRR